MGVAVGTGVCVGAQSGVVVGGGVAIGSGGDAGVVVGIALGMVVVIALGGGRGVEVSLRSTVSAPAAFWLGTAQAASIQIVLASSRGAKDLFMAWPTGG